MSEQRDTHEFLEKKADHAFQIECAAQARLSEAQSELDRREWRMQNADVALDETNMQIQSQRIERYRQIIRLIRIEGKRARSVTNYK